MIDELLEQTQRKATTDGAPGSTETANTNVSQLGDAAAERLIELAVSNADRPFIQELLRQKQEIGVKIAAMATNLRQLSVFRARLATPRRHKTRPRQSCLQKR